ncbi:carbonic anhydrase [Gallaecimonas kandeliae]|uniref:carbonic anhydrase n=1 Tax=Gallaecimonas kandeliae TaxID=3029055 RepID=UPI0026488A61|nr:carbonic anhydrase [Gallaecimonas kandeliae]WKE66299.1 carbonic anhydrase [Gallaecimonas kandeliae]
MKDPQTLLANNREWAHQMRQSDPAFFERLAERQNPHLLWIGCADSRVPAEQLTGLLPGELFVHRNVANQVLTTDINCQAVIDFAVGALKVSNVIVCGHYGCGGVMAALQGGAEGSLGQWLLDLKEVAERHSALLEGLTLAEQANRLCELNVLEAVCRVARSPAVQKAWSEGQKLSVHGWIYGVADGELAELGLTIKSQDDIVPARDKVLGSYFSE